MTSGASPQPQGILRALRVAAHVAVSTLLVACAPKARPLVGAPTPARLPQARLPEHAQRLVFRWGYADADGFNAKGEGVARVAPPDSARLDFFVDGGFGGGWAILLGDRLTAPGGDLVKRLVPPPPMLWAALGRLALPAAHDTVARLSGDTLRADVGTNPTWRVTFVGPRISRVERIDGGRIVEWMARGADGALRYESETGHRALTLNVVRTEEVESFAPSVWRP